VRRTTGSGSAPARSRRSAAATASLLWDLFPEAASDDEDGGAGAVFRGPAQHLADTVRRGGATDTDALAYGAQWAIRELAAAHPQLIAVDDLHWADEVSRHLLVSIALRLRTERVLLVVTSLPDGRDDTLAALLADSRTVLLEPQPLSASGVAWLADHAGRAGLEDPEHPGLEHPGVDVDRLVERTGGNPFYVREILRGERGSLTRLTSAVHLRLSRLSPGAREVAETLAVAGDPLPLGTLRLVADRAASETTYHAPEAAAPEPAAPSTARPPLRSALSELDAAALVTMDDGVLRIVPPVVAEVIVAGLTPGRRAELHERIAAAMHEEGMPLAAIASHEMNAQPSGDQRRVAVLVESARLAEAAGTPALAATTYARARREGGLDETTRIELTLAEGRARTVAGEGDAGLALISEVVRGIADPRARGRCWAELGDLAYMVGNAEASATAYERARATLEADGEASEEARLVLAKILASEGTLRTEVWTAVLAAAEEAAAPDDGVLDRADAAFDAVVALAMVLTGSPSAGARRVAARAAAAGLQTGGGDDPITYVISGALGDLAMVDEAEEWLGAALADARARGSVVGAATARYARGTLRLRFGRVRAGLADLEASWSGIGLGRHTYFYAIRHALALALLRTGERERAVAVASTPPHGHDSAFPLIGRTTELMLALETDDVEAAARHADALLGVPNPFVHAGIEWRPQMAKAYLRRGEPGDAERARLLIREALDQLDEQALPLNRAAVVLEAARLAVDGEAEALYEQVIDLVGDAPVYEAAAARIALASFEVARGELDQARERVRLALDYAVREGVRPLSAEAYDLLMLIDPSPSLIDADERLALLSASELRIAAAAAGGLNNRQIARDHFVTMRTVEFHLTNVYRKLSISGRDELRRIIP